MYTLGQKKKKTITKCKQNLTHYLKSHCCLRKPSKTEWMEQWKLCVCSDESQSKHEAMVLKPPCTCCMSSSCITPDSRSSLVETARPEMGVSNIGRHTKCAGAGGPLGQVWETLLNNIIIIHVSLTQWSMEEE